MMEVRNSGILRRILLLIAVYFVSFPIQPSKGLCEARLKNDVQVEDESLSSRLKDRWLLEVKQSIDAHNTGRFGIYISIKYVGIPELSQTPDEDIVVSHRVKSLKMGDITIDMNDLVGEVSMRNKTGFGRFFLPEQIKGLENLKPGKYPVTLVLEGDIYKANNPDQSLKHWQVELQEEIELNNLILGKRNPEAQADFKSLSVEISGIWRSWQKSRFKVMGDGSVEFSMSKGSNNPERYRSTFDLNQKNLISLNKLLEQTGWLTKPGANIEPGYTDASRINITLERQGKIKKAWCHDRNPEPYGALIKFIEQIYRQEDLLKRMTLNKGMDRLNAAYQIKDELRAIRGEPVAAGSVRILDYHRFVPVCAEVIANTDTNHRETIRTALWLLAYLRVESQRDLITGLTTAKQTASEPQFSQAKTEYTQIAAINALAALGGDKSILHIRKLAKEHEEKKVWVNGAIVEALFKLDGINSIELFKSMLQTTPSAGWALIRLGEPAIPAITELLEEMPPKPPLSMGQIYLIRQYIDNWEDIPKPIDHRVINAVKANLDYRLSFSNDWTTYHREFLKLTNASEPEYGNSREIAEQFLLAVKEGNNEQIIKKITKAGQSDWQERLLQLRQLPDLKKLEIVEVNTDQADNVAWAVCFDINNLSSYDNYVFLILNYVSGKVWRVVNISIQDTPLLAERVYRRYLEKYPNDKSDPKAVLNDNLDLSLKKYRTDDFEFEAGFIPDKAEYVWGEPMHYFTYIVKNTGDKTLSFVEGGDYRGGRSESYKIAAIDANGKPVPIPEMGMGGGLAHIVNLEPGETYTKMLPVLRRLTFSEPGVYTVTGNRTLKLGQTLEEARNLRVITANSFQLTIHPYSKERMAIVVKEIADEIWAAGNIAPRAIEMTEPTEITKANRLHMALSSLTEIKHETVLPTLITMAQKGQPRLREAALVRLGKFTEKGELLSYATLLEALDDVEESIRSASAEGLGIMNNDAAIDVLIVRLPKAKPQVAASILRAMGRTKSQHVFDIIVGYLNHKDNVYRHGAVDGLARFNGENSVEALKRHINNEEDMDLREYIVKTLAESMRQSIDPQWLVPVIKSRKGTHSIGDAPRLMRLYGGPKSVPALLSCLDYENPSIRSSYNWWVIYSQSSCDGGLITPWISDLNRNGTPEEIENNRKTLKILKAWAKHYYEYRLDEKAMEKWPDRWGKPVDGISIRARLNQRVWPEGIPQLTMFDVRSHPGEGSIHISNVPEPLEIELNGEWYVRKPALKEATAGLELMGESVQNIVLDENWRRKSDGKQLKLKSGDYTLRVGLSIRPKNQRTGLAISKPIQFEVIEID